MRSQAVKGPLIPVAEHTQQQRGAMIEPSRVGRAQPSHRPYRLASLPLEVTTKGCPRPMTVLPRDRTLRVGEPGLVRRVSKRVSQTRERVGLTSARRTQKLLRRLAVVLDLLDRGKAVIDLAWCLWHDRHLH
jgi:hypothetical protein